MPDFRERLLPEALRSRAAPFSGSYQAIGTPITNQSRIIKLTNTSDVEVLISWNGMDDHEIIPSGGFLLLDCSSNAANPGILVAAAGTQFYAKGTAGTTGSVYLSTYYAF